MKEIRFKIGSHNVILSNFAYWIEYCGRRRKLSEAFIDVELVECVEVVE